MSSYQVNKLLNHFYVRVYGVMQEYDVTYINTVSSNKDDAPLSYCFLTIIYYHLVKEIWISINILVSMV